MDGALVEHRVESSYLLDGFRSLLEFPVAYSAPGMPITDRYRIAFQADGQGRLRELDAPDSPTDPPNTEPQRGLAELVSFQHLGGSVWSRNHANGMTEDLTLPNTPSGPCEVRRSVRRRLFSSAPPRVEQCPIGDRGVSGGESEIVVQGDTRWPAESQRS